MNLHEKLKPGWRLAGPSTRPTTLTSGERIAFTKQALEQAVDRIKSAFVPQMVEHLSFLPPIGRITDAELIEDDGYFWLALLDEPLAAGTSTDAVLPVAPSEESGPAGSFSVKLGTEPRNFDRDDFAAMEEDAPFQVGTIALHSDLPPIVWSFAITLGGLGAFGAKAFVQEFCKQLGSDSATSFVSWLKSAASKAKESDREQLAEFRIEAPGDVEVTAYCPFSPDSADSLTQLADAISRITDVAAFAGTLEYGRNTGARRIAYIWDADGWHLAWWATDDGSFPTEWLKKNAPDPSRFLGGLPPTLRLLSPYLPSLPGATTPPAVDKPAAALEDN